MKPKVHQINSLSTYSLLDALDELQHDEQFDLARFNKIGQCCVNTTIDYPNDHYYGCGSPHYNWEASYYDDTLGELVVPVRDTPMDVSTFHQTSSIFTGTLFDTLIEDLKQHYKIGRVRIMALSPKTCLSWHTDSNNRLHYPIKTQPGCLMIFENETHYLEENCWYLTETNGNHHTAINGSTEIRYHLVVELL